MDTALITLSEAGARLLAPLVGKLPGARLYVHESVSDAALDEMLFFAHAGGTQPETGATNLGERHPPPAKPQAPGAGQKRRGDASSPESAGLPGAVEPAERFAKISGLTKRLFPLFRNLVYAAPCGVVVRAVAPLVQSKYSDPAVVVLDVGGRWAISLLSGHEGGANDLALRMGNLTGAEPIITTTTEAVRSVIVGVGCRRGTSAETLVGAIRKTLAEEGVALEEVRYIASADIKGDETGLIEAGGILGVPLRFIPSSEIIKSERDFAHSDFVSRKVHLPAVAEPAALLAGRRTSFICRKKIVKGITIALAREEFSWSASAPEGRQTEPGAPKRQ